MSEIEREPDDLGVKHEILRDVNTRKRVANYAHKLSYALCALNAAHDIAEALEPQVEYNYWEISESALHVGVALSEVAEDLAAAVLEFGGDK